VPSRRCAESGAGVTLLPDEIIATVKHFANEATKQKRLLAYVLREFIEENEVPHGKLMHIYDEIAAIWHECTGEEISGRTVRYWVQSVSQYSRAELQAYAPLSDAQLIEAVKLASDCQNDMTPQIICQYCVDQQIDTVTAMRAKFLPATGDGVMIDNPKLTAIIRWFTKLVPQTSPHYGRMQEIIAEVRSWYTEEA
jgi:hypothetical protein